MFKKVVFKRKYEGKCVNFSFSGLPGCCGVGVCFDFDFSYEKSFVHYNSCLAEHLFGRIKRMAEDNRVGSVLISAVKDTPLYEWCVDNGFEGGNKGSINPKTDNVIYLFEYRFKEKR